MASEPELHPDHHARVQPTWAPRFAFMFLACLAGVAGSSWFLWHEIGHPREGIDDANITFVYARHLSQGHGFVYNIGGERVEGASSPLWTGLATLFYSIADHPEPWLGATSVLAVSLAMAFFLVVVLRGAPRGSWTGVVTAVIFLLWTLALPRFVGWTCLTLMETGLWCAEIIAAMAMTLLWADPAFSRGRGATAFSSLVAALAITRPEGPLVAGLFLVLAWSLDSTRVGMLGAAGRIAVPVSALGGTVLVATLARLVYFGVPLPNTYYAKVGGDLGYELSRGWDYLREFCSASPGVLVAGLLGLVLWVIVRRGRLAEKDPLLGALAACATTAPFAALCIPVLLGGDHFDGYRFFVPFGPLFAIPLIVAVRMVLRSGLRRGVHTLVVTVLALTSGLLATLGSSTGWDDAAKLSFRREFQYAARGRKVGQRLSSFFPEGERPSVGVIMAGGFKLAYPGPVYDLMGMNWTRMARANRDRDGARGHAAFDAAVFWSEPPSILLPSFHPMSVAPQPINEGSFENRALHGLLLDERFLGVYAFGRLTHESPAGRNRVVGYFRRDFLDDLSVRPDLRFGPLTGP